MTKKVTSKKSKTTKHTKVIDKKNPALVPKKRYRYRTLEQRLELAKKICDEYAKDEYTIASICEANDLPIGSWYNWVREESNGYIAEIKDLYEKSKERNLNSYLDRLEQKARRGLEMLVEGFETEERVLETTIVVTDTGETKYIPKKSKVTKKRVAPSVTANIFALKNAIPSVFKDRHEHDVDLQAKGALFDFLRDKGAQSLDTGDNPPEVEEDS